MALNWIPQFEYDPGGGAITITLDFPVRKEPFGEGHEFSGKVQEATSGRLQTLTNFIAESNKLTFSHVSEANYLLMKAMLNDHAIRGKSFDFWFDKDDNATKFSVQLSRRSRSPDWKVQASTGVDSFIRRITLTLRRVVG